MSLVNVTGSAARTAGRQQQDGDQRANQREGVHNRARHYDTWSLALAMRWAIARGDWPCRQSSTGNPRLALAMTTAIAAAEEAASEYAGSVRHHSPGRMNRSPVSRPMPVHLRRRPGRPARPRLAAAGSPFFDVLLGDAHGYDEWARRIAGGEWIGTRRLLPGAAVSVLPRRHLRDRRPQPARRPRSSRRSSAPARARCSRSPAAGSSRARSGSSPASALAIYAPAIFFDGAAPEVGARRLLPLALAVADQAAWSTTPSRSPSLARARRGDGRAEPDARKRARVHRRRSSSGVETADSTAAPSSSARARVARHVRRSTAPSLYASAPGSSRRSSPASRSCCCRSRSGTTPSAAAST